MLGSLVSGYRNRINIDGLSTSNRDFSNPAITLRNKSGEFALERKRTVNLDVIVWC